MEALEKPALRPVYLRLEREVGPQTRGRRLEAGSAPVWWQRRRLNPTNGCRAKGHRATGDGRVVRQGRSQRIIERQ